MSEVVNLVASGLGIGAAFRKDKPPTPARAEEPLKNVNEESDANKRKRQRAIAQNFGIASTNRTGPGGVGGSASGAKKQLFGTEVR